MVLNFILVGLLLRVSKFENDYLQYTEQCRLVNEMVKTAKETYFATIIEINKGDQRSLFQSIDRLLNSKAVPRFPSSSSDLEVAESFKNFFANKIEPIRAPVWLLRHCLPVKRFVVTIILMNLQIFDRYRPRKYQILLALK